MYSAPGSSARWLCQNVGSNPGLGGRDACVHEQDT